MHYLGSYPSGSMGRERHMCNKIHHPVGENPSSRSYPPPAWGRPTSNLPSITTYFLVKDKSYHSPPGFPRLGIPIRSLICINSFNRVVFRLKISLIRTKVVNGICIHRPTTTSAWIIQIFGGRDLIEITNRHWEPSCNFSTEEKTRIKVYISLGGLRLSGGLRSR